MRAAKEMGRERKWHPAEKVVPGRSISTFESSLQDDVEEVGAEDSVEVISYRFCYKQNNRLNS
jgi:hypothetical protein